MQRIPKLQQRIDIVAKRLLEAHKSILSLRR
jgi:hypothetical protein